MSTHIYILYTYLECKIYKIYDIYIYIYVYMRYSFHCLHAQFCGEAFEKQILSLCRCCRQTALYSKHSLHVLHVEALQCKQRKLTHICIHISMFVNEIPASARTPGDPDLARFSGPIKIAQTLAHVCFWRFLAPTNRVISDCLTQTIFGDFHNIWMKIFELSFCLKHSS